jgi:anti-anti-sigma factor
MEELKIEMLDNPWGARILRLAGPLTIRTLFDFQHAARQSASQPVIIDLSQVPYMDSAGLGTMISVFTTCLRDHRGFGIVGLADRIRTLFQLTHVDGILPCFASLEVAEAAVRKD